MPTPINVRCPNCSGMMIVDPHYLSAQTTCPHCGTGLLPASHVHLQPTVQPLPVNPPAQRNAFELDDDDDPPPRRRSASSRRHSHTVEGSFTTGFGGCFGGCLGMVAAVIVVIAGLVITGTVLGDGCRSSSTSSRR